MVEKIKGIILAGGTGSRLFPLTKITNKHLLPIYNNPMIYYPLQTLINAGIKDILIIVGGEHVGDFMRLLGSGKEFGVKLSYEIQDNAKGIAHALLLAEDFASSNNVAVILGDNIFQDDLKEEVENFHRGAKIFLKKVDNPSKFGVVEIQGEKIINIEEKPKNPKSDYCVTGFYLYDQEVFDFIRNIKPSKRGELEITDINNIYIKLNYMKYSILKGFWIDAGTFESLNNANSLIRDYLKRKNL